MIPGRAMLEKRRLNRNRSNTCTDEHDDAPLDESLEGQVLFVLGRQLASVAELIERILVEADTFTLYRHCTAVFLRPSTRPGKFLFTTVHNFFKILDSASTTGRFNGLFGVDLY